MFLSIVSAFQHIPSLGICTQKHPPKFTLARLGLRWARLQVQLSKIISPIQSLKNLLKKVIPNFTLLGNTPNFQDTFIQFDDCSTNLSQELDNVTRFPGRFVNFVKDSKVKKIQQKLSKALVAWLLVRGVSQRKRRRRGRRRYFPWRGCALPRCNLRGGGFMRTESGGFENTLSLLRIICSLIIIITKTVKIDSIENLYWMCFHCVLCLGSIGNISEHVLYGTLPMAVKQSDGCLEKDLSLWRQGRGNRDKFSHNV